MLAETVAILKVRRERLGLSLEVVASELEVTRQTLWRWEAKPRRIRKGMLQEWERIIAAAERRAREGAA